MISYVNSALSRVSELNVWVLTILFLLPFIATLLLIPWIIIRLPADYFLLPTRTPLLAGLKQPLLRIILIIAKNILGILILLMGIAMLILPGQGLLTMLIGLLMLDFPGKFTCQRWLLGRGPVLRSVNWIRSKNNREAFKI